MGSPRADALPTIETPDEALRRAHAAITIALAADLLDRVRKASPAFFERPIVSPLLQAKR